MRSFQTIAKRSFSVAPKQVQSNMTVPVWWSGSSALDEESFTIDCTGLDMTKENPALVEQMHEVCDRTGVVLLRNTGLTKLDPMSKWIRCMVETGAYQGGANSRQSLADNVFDTGAPRHAHLHYHHEMAYMAESIRALGFACNHAVQGKGETYLSDNLVATDAILATEMGQKLKEKGICYIRCLTDREVWQGREQHGIYNHWQRSFGVETVEEVEVLAEKKGLKIEWGPERFLKTKCYISAFEYFPKLDRNLLYSSVADDAMWFDTWPGVCDLPTMPSYAEVSADHRPLKLTYGDDTEFTPEELKLFVDVYDLAAIRVEWQVGDILSICNYRWAHGRPAFELDDTEQRNLGVVLGTPFPRVGQRDDKW